jgi:hypothetical protein
MIRNPEYYLAVFELRGQAQDGLISKAPIPYETSASRDEAEEPASYVLKSVDSDTVESDLFRLLLNIEHSLRAETRENRRSQLKKVTSKTEQA